MNKLMLFLIFLLIFFSCKNEIKDIELIGKVLDSETELPIDSARLVILCWKESGFEWSDVDYVKKETYSNKFGSFNLHFEKGLWFDIAILLKDNKAYTFHVENIKDNTVSLKIKLQKQQIKQEYFENSVDLEQLLLNDMAKEKLTPLEPE